MFYIRSSDCISLSAEFWESGFCLRPTPGHFKRYSWLCLQEGLLLVPRGPHGLRRLNLGPPYVRLSPCTITPPLVLKYFNFSRFLSHLGPWLLYSHFSIDSEFGDLFLLFVFNDYSYQCYHAVFIFLWLILLKLILFVTIILQME